LLYLNMVTVFEPALSGVRRDEHIWNTLQNI
jgi:hypothetical protein